MSRLAAALERWLRRFADGLGPAGLIGAALAATCIGYFAGSIQPLREQIVELRSAPSVDLRTARSTAGSDSPRERLQAFVTAFPDARELSRLLATLYALADSDGLRLAQAEYRLVDADALGMMQYRIALPLRGSYPRIRHFLAAVLAEIPGVALNQFNLQRERIGQGQVEAQLELTLHLRAVDATYAKRSIDLEQVSAATEAGR